jgi:hypothetical protein
LTYRAPTIKVHNTLSVAADYGRRSIESVTLDVVYGPPRLQTSASSRRPGSASLPTTRDPYGSVSYWFRRINHHGSVRRTSRRHVGFKTMRIVPKGGRRSGARRYLHAPTTYASSSKRRGFRRSIALRPTWVRRWHISNRTTLCPRLTRLWLTSGSPQLWWKKRA